MLTLPSTTVRAGAKAAKKMLPVASPIRAVRSSNSASRARMPVAVQVAATKSPLAAFADSIGLPTEEGFFGFIPFAETWTGRLAMMGFVTSFAVELQTGQGTLAQIGITDTPSGELLAALLSVVVVGSVVGAGAEVYRGFSGKMPKAQLKRYQKFLLLDKEQELISAARAEKTMADTFLQTSNNLADIAAVRAEGMAADKVLGEASPSGTTVIKRQPDGSLLVNFSAAESAAAAASASQQPQQLQAVPVAASGASASARPKTYDDVVFGSDELRYAREVELNNGRMAMIGFLAAILVEAATGRGIIMQLFMWFKLMGLLGPESGF